MTNISTLLLALLGRIVPGRLALLVPGPFMILVKCQRDVLIFIECG